MISDAYFVSDSLAPLLKSLALSTGEQHCQRASNWLEWEIFARFGPPRFSESNYARLNLVLKSGRRGTKWSVI